MSSQQEAQGAPPVRVAAMALREAEHPPKKAPQKRLRVDQPPQVVLLNAPKRVRPELEEAAQPTAQPTAVASIVRDSGVPALDVGAWAELPGVPGPAPRPAIVIVPDTVPASAQIPPSAGVEVVAPSTTTAGAAASAAAAAVSGTMAVTIRPVSVAPRRRGGNSRLPSSTREDVAGRPLPTPAAVEGRVVVVPEGAVPDCSSAAILDEALKRGRNRWKTLLDNEVPDLSMSKRATAFMKDFPVVDREDPVRPYACSVCSRAFTTVAHVRAHALHNHAPPEAAASWVCPFTDAVDGRPCGTALRSRRGLSKHYVEEHVLGRRGCFECPWPCCGLAFGDASCLTIHFRTHTGDKPFKCDVCGRCFSDKSNLKVHMRGHTGDKPFKCDVCGHGFAHMSHLKEHILTHTGQKPFKCSLCAKAFKRSTHLNEHMRTHTGLRPFVCQQCGRSFTQSSALSRHLSSHAKEADGASKGGRLVGGRKKGRDAAAEGDGGSVAAAAAAVAATAVEPPGAAGTAPSQAAGAASGQQQQ